MGSVAFAARSTETKVEWRLIRELPFSRAPVVLICAPDPLCDELYQTVLWDPNVERHLAFDLCSALATAVAVRPDLVVLQRDLPEADRLIAYLRSTPRLVGTAIAVIARGRRLECEAALLGAGADAILRLPATPDWDARLLRLLLPAIRP